MNTTSLPDDLNIDQTAPIQVYNYRIFDSCLRNQINLSKNTFSFLIEGTKEVITDNKSVYIENDQFLIIKSGHCLMTETISASNKTYKSMLLFFSDEMLFNFLTKSQLLATGSTHQASSYLVCSYDNYIKHFVQSLENISLLNKQLQHSLLKLKFEEIMTYLVQKEGAYFLQSILDNYDDTTSRFIKVVENNKLNKLTLQELSFLCTMSLSTFKRAFTKHYQIAPIKWFQEQRLAHAAFLLSTKQQRPTEVYLAAGYETLSNFVQAFKKQYGLTPKQFQLKK